MCDRSKGAIGENGMAGLSQQKRNPLSNPRRECFQCSAVSCCLSDGLSAEQLNSLKKITRINGPFQPGQAIFRIEDSFKSLFLVQSGSVKIQSVMHDGTQLVDGFFFQGDLVGLEAIGDKQYSHDAIALEPTWVCDLPFDQLESLCAFIPRLQRRIMELLGQKIRQTNNNIGHGRYMKAEERLLLFLETLCKRKVIQKGSGQESIQLPMTKGDIASYLGLRPESLSRALHRLQDEGVIRNHKKAIEILDVNAAFSRICK